MKIKLTGFSAVLLTFSLFLVIPVNETKNVWVVPTSSNTFELVTTGTEMTDEEPVNTTESVAISTSESVAVTENPIPISSPESVAITENSTQSSPISSPEPVANCENATQSVSTTEPQPQPVQNQETEPEPVSQETCQPLLPPVCYDQKVVLYSEKEQRGQKFEIHETNEPDLPKKNFDNRATSFCITGIWLFYVERNYNSNPNAGMEWVFGPNNFCSNFKYVSGYVRSARSVGSPEDYRADTLTIFRDLYFQGDKEYMYTNRSALSSSLESNHKSLIITGSNPWTVYTESNYEGTAVCLFPPKSNDTSPYFLYDLKKANISYGCIKSARKGCFVENINNTCNNNNNNLNNSTVPPVRRVTWA